jgi:hypothetical protein
VDRQNKAVKMPNNVGREWSKERTEGRKREKWKRLVRAVK